MVVRRGGSQDYILGGSAENSRAPLRLRSRGEPSSQPAGRTGRRPNLLPADLC